MVSTANCSNYIGDTGMTHHARPRSADQVSDKVTETLERMVAMTITE